MKPEELQKQLTARLELVEKSRVERLKDLEQALRTYPPDYLITPKLPPPQYSKLWRDLNG